MIARFAHDWLSRRNRYFGPWRDALANGTLRLTLTLAGTPGSWYRAGRLTWAMSNLVRPPQAMRRLKRQPC